MILIGVGLFPKKIPLVDLAYFSSSEQKGKGGILNKKRRTKHHSV